jgi:glycosyltransferase involved in cell wall biosynthesis
MALPCILIPAYKPDRKMIELIEALQAAAFCQIIVVDDGSGPAFTPLFNQALELSCTVLRHSINMGKGRAVKTGLNHGLLAGKLNDGVITADADGQHTPADILKIAAAMADDPAALVLGVRNFSGAVPLKSRLGNGITRFFFSLIHGGDVRDTQTGLRGLPAEQIPLFLSLPGERYEYEMNMLLSIRPHEIKLIQIPIDTVYIEGNRSSHFNVVQDSVRIYRLLVKFIASSLVSTVVDYAVFAIMNITVANQLIGSVVVARSISSLINFSINKNIVFKRKSTGKNAIFRYYALVIFIMMASYGLIKLFNLGLGLNLYLSKLIADCILYFVSFIVQREFVYRR